MPIKELTLESIAKDAGGYFEQRTRDNGEKFYCTVDNTPDWITDMVREAHGDKLPDNYIYNWADSALDNIATGDMTEDNIHEYIDSEVDVYTAGLTAWLHSRCDRVYYLTEALDDFEPKDGFQALSMAQYAEIREVFNSVMGSIQARLEELQ